MCKKIFIATMLVALFSLSIQAANVSKDPTTGMQYIKEFINGANEPDDEEDDNVKLGLAFIDGKSVVFSFVVKSYDLDEQSSDELAVMKTSLKSSMIETYSAVEMKEVLRPIYKAGYIFEIRFYDKYGRPIVNVPMSKKDLGL